MKPGALITLAAATFAWPPAANDLPSRPAAPASCSPTTGRHRRTRSRPDRGRALQAFVELGPGIGRPDATGVLDRVVIS
ncbi:MAG TPA: hypothetical protein VJU01_02735 [Gaiellaceae bacterium]|nr:hypothetical protein [Gaiellaceae bacterium]